MALEALVRRPCRTGRRLGRPDRLEQHQDQGDDAASAPSDYSGRYVYYGVREHGMAAAMNGMALHGGVIPYGGTFLVFSDYCRRDPHVGAPCASASSM
jgi:transketolase